MFDSLHFASNHFASKHWTKAGKGLKLFTIGKFGRLGNLQPSSLIIQQHMNNRSTASFTLVGLDGYKPLIGEEVIIESAPCKGEPFKRIFAGHIKDINSSNLLCDTTVFHEVTCVDYNALLDKRLVFQIYEDQTVASVIEKIHRDFLNGENITLGNVDTGNIKIKKSVFSYTKCSKVFNDISTQTGLFWFIDFDRDLHFFPRSKKSTEFFLNADCSFVNIDTKKFCAYINNQTCNEGIKHANIVVNRRSDQVVNEQFIIAGNDETKQRQESFVGDGERQAFSLKYEMSQLKKGLDGIIAADAITLDSGGGPVNQTVASRDDNEDGEPVGAQWYFEKGSYEIVQDDGDTPITSADTLRVNFKGLYKVVVKNRNISPTIADYRKIENTSGLYQNVDDDESIESKAYAQSMADGLVRKFQRGPITVNFSTDILVINIGDVISVNLPDHDIDMPNGFIVNAIGIQEIENKLMRFSYELISTENQGDWQEYFRKIEFFGRQLKLREQQELVNSDTGNEGVDPETGEVIQIITQTFKSSLGIGDLNVQDKGYDRCMVHSFDPLDGTELLPSRTFHNYNFHCVPEVVRLGLV